MDVGQPNDTLFVIRSGAVDIVSDDNLLLDRRDTGLNFGYSTLVGTRESRYLMEAVEDSVLLMLPRDAFADLLDAHPELHRFFETASRRVQAAAEEVRDNGTANVLRTPLSDVVADRSLVTCDAATPIVEAARIMGERHASCLVVTGGEQIGIVTDRQPGARGDGSGFRSGQRARACRRLRPRRPRQLLRRADAIRVSWPRSRRSGAVPGGDDGVEPRVEPGRVATRSGRVR